jgi:hypothetical protein
VKPRLKIGVVICGYVAALLIASAAVTIRVAVTPTAVAQASSGMYAFGDSLLFVAVFGVFALVPTGAALFFLRPYHRFWVVLSAIGVVVGLTGIIAATLFLLGRHATASTLAWMAALSVLRMLIAPLLALMFLACVILAPLRPARLAFVAALAMEMVVCACGGFVWFIPFLLHKP